MFRVRIVSRWATLAALCSLGLLLAACGEDGIAVPTSSSASEDPPDSEAPTTEPPVTEAPTTEPPATEPPVTEAPTTEPPATEPPATEAPTESVAPPVDDLAGDGPADDGGITLLFMLVVVGILLTIAALGFLVTRSSRREPEFVLPEPVDPYWPLVGNLQWLHDQFSLEVLSAPPAQAVERWREQRPRVDNMAIACQQRGAAEGNDGRWSQLASTVSSLARAMDTAVVSRADSTVDQAVTHEAIEVVNEQRARLQLQLESVGRSGVA